MPSNKRPKPRSYRSLKGLTGEAVAALLPAGRIDDGSHGDPHDKDDNADGELCLMEAVAYITGEPHSDTPRCADPDLTAIGIAFNDSHSGDRRELDDLVSAIPALVGSKTGSARVRFRRAREMARLLIPKAVEELREEFSERPSERLIDELETLERFGTKREAERILEILGFFADDTGGDAFTSLLHALETLVKRWNTEGITKKVYEDAMPGELQSIFTEGAEQADVLNALGHIRN